jgi:queuine/archaeosine tRNA-ribosyltransferase
MARAREAITAGRLAQLIEDVRRRYATSDAPTDEA